MRSGGDLRQSSADLADPLGAYAIILVSYFTLGVLYWFLPMVLAILGSRGPGSITVFRLITAINPVVSTFLLVEPRAGLRLGNPWLACVLIHLAFSALLLVLSSLLLRRFARRVGQAATPSEPALPLPSPLQTPQAPVPINPSPLPPARQVSDNPVLWRELRRTLFPSRKLGLLAFLAAVILLVISYLSLNSVHALDEDETQIGYAWVFQILGMLLTCVLSATAIAQEKESDTWTLLLTTPLSGQAIVLGKVLGILRRLLWPCILVAAHFLIFVIGGVIPFLILPLVLWVLISFNSLWLATGLLLSVRLKTVTFAVILNLLLPLFIYGIPPIVLAMIDELAGIPGDDLPEMVLWYLPYYYLGEGIDHFPTFWLPTMHGRSTDVPTFFFVAFAIGLIQILLSSLILWNVACRFNRLVGRAPNQALPDYTPQVVTKQ